MTISRGDWKVREDASPYSDYPHTTRPDQAAIEAKAGVKRGDRVRLASGGEGEVLSVTPGRLWVVDDREYYNDVVNISYRSINTKPGHAQFGKPWGPIRDLKVGKSKYTKVS